MGRQQRLLEAVFFKVTPKICKYTLKDHYGGTLFKLLWSKTERRRENMPTINIFHC